MSWKTIREMVRSGAYAGVDRGKDVKKFLEHHGFAVIPGRGKGSHWWLAKVVDDRPVGVSVPKGSIGIGLLKQILKQARII